ncbi:UDP-glucosyltransferase 2-like isoform X2 [Planococcus citri]|uniref:UDP-glucosyltransferase 2-like isoform X2 n=1 Tax=Planococcus citri TaxID=170843 RepID=UPI0031F92DE9
MQMDTYTLSLVCLSYLVLYSSSSCEGARILGVFPIGGISHYAPAEAVLKALAARGHDVTVISSYPQKTPLKNFHDIDVSKVKRNAVNSLSFDLVRTALQSASNNFYYVAEVSRTYCEVAFSMPEVQALLDEKFDLVMTEIFGADCNVGFAWKYKAPLVSLISSRPLPWTYSRVGSPQNPSYMRQVHIDYSLPMTFWQRLENTYYYLYFSVFYDLHHNGPLTDKMSKEFFGPRVPSVRDIVQNTSLVLVNSHHSVESAYPLTPNFIEIGGIHIKKAKPLPSDIQKFMDEAKQGVIYFTLGSLVRTSTLPKQVIEAFRDAFAELPVKVLWKFELELENIPPNVYISKWFPQSDILAHPNLKAYITHGGQLGTLEAVYNAVPLVGIPMFHDQHGNIQSLVEKGAAVKLGLNNLVKDKILTALKAVLFDKSYAENMKKLSQKFKDRPLSAADTAVYWIEYVLRHEGAHHLRSAATDMPWYQYFLIDVISFIAIIFICFIFIIRYIIKFIVNLILRNISSKNKSD